ncbi:acetate/propionate family kinase [bacterium]|nr:acetate/propionate family kinase [bacterium]
MIFIVNCGSQSIKWKLFQNTLSLEKEGKRNVFRSRDFRKYLREELRKVLSYRKEINIIGHRVVHGGLKYRNPTIITQKVLQDLQQLSKYAPLHNPYNILGIKEARKFFPKVKQVAVFDTGFFAFLPQKASYYPLPKEILKKYGFQRLGFHGISHEYAAREAAKEVKKPFERLKIITCHLGGGMSISAIKNGRAVETSMGFTPLEGLMMMTRAGDIDAGIVLGLCKRLSPKKTEKILNFDSGVVSIAGTKDMLEILDKARKGNKKAKFALEIFSYRIKKYIGAYFAVLGNCDVLVFTGMIGWGSRKVRSMICKELSFLNKTRVLSIAPNEELAIARKLANKVSV